MSQYDRMHQTSLYPLAGENQRKSDSFPRASALSSNARMTITALLIARIASIPSQKASTFVQLLSPFTASFVIRAMSPLMESLCGGNVIMIASLVTMM